MDKEDYARNYLEQRRNVRELSSRTKIGEAALEVLLSLGLAGADKNPVLSRDFFWQRGYPDTRVSAIVGNLINKGLVQASLNPHNRQTYFLTLTPEATKTYEELKDNLQPEQEGVKFEE